jgi:hypothetical protein
MAAPRGATAHSVPNQVRGQPGAVIVKVTGGDVDELKAAGLLGVNTALSRCVPTASVDVVPEAVPLETGTGLPRLVVPSRNCAVPAAVAGVIVAVSVTGVPWATGEAGDVLRRVVVATAPVGPVIVKVTGGDVDELKAAGLLGVNTALSRCVPTASVDVVPDAVPLETGTGLPGS